MFTRPVVPALLTSLALVAPLSWSMAEPPSSRSKDRAVHDALTKGKDSVAGALADQGRGPIIGSFSVRTGVFAPDGGSVLLGGVTSGGETRRESGVPVLGKTPVAGRPFNNGSFGRTTEGTWARVFVRIIDLQEEELRQTGYSSRR